MSTRELEVAARVKARMSARQIAADLGIAETTVITHRNGAHARMGVANLRELCSLSLTSGCGRPAAFTASPNRQGIVQQSKDRSQ
jgi:DNA-binding CsgD family transcriptional regulator